jgi:hypothetical protein
LSRKKFMSLSPKGKQLLKHWEESNPHLVNELRKSGKLEQALKHHLNRELDVYAQAIENGLNPDQARELAEEELHPRVAPTFEDDDYR